MKTLFVAVFLLSFSCFVLAEGDVDTKTELETGSESDSWYNFENFEWDHIGLGDWSWEDISWKNISDMEGWTPRYSYVVDDNLLGRTHYMGMSFLKRQGAAHEGITLRGGFGHFGEKINLAFTSGFSFIGVDFGLSYLILDKKNARQHENEIEGLGVELGLRLWVVQLHAIHMDETSYINLAYGF